MDLPFGGDPRAGFRGFSPGESLGYRPVVLKPETKFLGYEELTDPEIRSERVVAIRSSASMILPGRDKRFSVETSVGIEREDFWNHLWARAADGLRRATEIVVIGYSLPVADRDARCLMLKTGDRRAPVRVCCGDDNGRIVQEFADAGFHDVLACAKSFHEWLSPIQR